ncbi:filamentous hemagglutinin N-terminal domain-containing protein [Caballeronia sp. LZ025]|uniref:two-partner secretion domain-containing protein n=1 Tax=Caballeronia TaxID=1827195 RepID=UPI001FD1F95E|nr:MULTISPECIES: filamentous hemagglutinin N-terminal domain-containing protein [Caballeronia]MDR5733676.1 filamentous hemagglutinin N-terminal domain-containing protein [Caballeronia sp. LZ025]
MSWMTGRAHRACLPRDSIASPFSFSLTSIALAVMFASNAGAAPPLPQCGQFVAGQGSISTQAKSVNITQTTSRGVIDWRSFSIGKGNTVDISNGSGATLNRVTGLDRSVIDGKLSATGSLYLINPQGVVIGRTGVVTTGGRFVASSLDASNSAFMAGGDLTLTGTGDGVVANLGKIGSSGGDVFLIARTAVFNRGEINAKEGTAELAVGSQVLLHDAASGQQMFVQAGSRGTVDASGAIDAAQISLQAAEGNVFALAGRPGELRATGTATRDGHVWLVAESGAVHAHGRIGAANADGSGGTVDMNGATLHVDNASIDAAKWNLATPVFMVDGGAAGALANALSHGTSVAVDTTGKGGKTGDIDVNASVRWNGDASLALNAFHAVTIAPAATVANNGAGNLTLRADASGVGNGGGVVNGGVIDWSRSVGIVSILRDMNSAYTPGTITTNAQWTAAPYSGLATQLTAYRLVNTRADLDAISADPGGVYALGKDIALTTPYAGIGVSSQTAFSGQFDGMGHTISGFRLVDPPAGSYARLFGTIATGGIVRNLNVDGTAATYAGANIGLLAGRNNGHVAGVHTAGAVYNGQGITSLIGGGLVAVNGGTIERSSSTASVSGLETMGGLAGTNSGVITQSYATGSVTGGSHADAVGGLVARNTGTIAQSYATGSTFTILGVSGGFAGDNAGTVNQSFATGPATPFGPNPIGGFIGVNGGSVSNDFWDVQTTGKTIGVNGSGAEGATGLTTAQMSTAQSFGPQWDFGPNGTWVIPAGGTHPILRWQLQTP